MSINDFRRMALGLPETSEVGHMGHPDFRVGGKIFATLGYPDDGWGMVKLTPKQQQVFVEAEPEVFVPAKGAWGLHGATTVLLRAARKGTLQRALVVAWQNTAPKSLARRHKALTSGPRG